MVNVTETVTFVAKFQYVFVVNMFLIMFAFVYCIMSVLLLLITKKY